MEGDPSVTSPQVPDRKKIGEVSEAWPWPFRSQTCGYALSTNLRKVSE